MLELSSLPAHVINEICERLSTPGCEKLISSIDDQIWLDVSKSVLYKQFCVISNKTNTYFEHFFERHAHLSVEPYYLDFEDIYGLFDFSNCKYVKKLDFMSDLYGHYNPTFRDRGRTAECELNLKTFYNCDKSVTGKFLKECSGVKHLGIPFRDNWARILWGKGKINLTVFPELESVYFDWDVELFHKLLLCPNIETLKTPLLYHYGNDYCKPKESVEKNLVFKKLTVLELYHEGFGEYIESVSCPNLKAFICGKLEATTAVQLAKFHTPQLEYLEVFDVFGSSKIDYTLIKDFLEYICTLKKVKAILLGHMADVNLDFEMFKELSKLKSLTLTRIPFQTMANLNNIPQLVELRLLCAKFESWPTLNKPSTLTTLELSFCPFTAIDSFRGFENLVNLTVDDCSNLRYINLHGLYKLETLGLNCCGLDEFPDFSTLRSLRFLEFDGNTLISNDNAESFASIETINLGWTTVKPRADWVPKLIQRFPNLKINARLRGFNKYGNNGDIIQENAAHFIL